MIEACEQLRLVEKAAPRRLILEPHRAQQLHDARLAALRLRRPHLTHAAARDGS
jgi:hypothetical protein